MKLTRVTILGMGNVDNKTYDLDHLTYLNGENGAGKTTVLSAIQLALLGYTGVSGKRSSSIFEHANSYAMTVVLNMVSDSDTQITVQRTFTRNGSKIQSSVTISPQGYDLDGLVKELELPIFNFNELLGMTANAQKDWWMSFLPPAATDITWKQALTDSSSDIVAACKEDYIQEMAEELKDCPMTVTGIREANTKLKATQSFLKSEISRLEDTIKSLVYYAQVSDVDSEALQIEMKELQTARDAAAEAFLQKGSWDRANVHVEDTLAKILETYPTLDDARANVAQLRETMVNLQAEINNMSAQIAEAQKAVGPYHFVRQKFEGSLCPTEPPRPPEMNIVLDTVADATCPIMGTPCQELCEYYRTHQEELQKTKSADTKAYEEAMRQYTADKAAWDKTYQDFQEAEAAREAAYQEEYNSRYAVVTQLQEAQMQNQSRLQEITAQWNQQAQMIQDYESGCNVRNTYDPNKVKTLMYSTLEEYDNELAALRDTLVKVKANAQYVELNDQMTKEKFRNMDKLELVKVWIAHTGVNGLQNTVMQGPFLQFAEDTYAILCDLFDNKTQLTFHLSEKANDFSFGITRCDQQYIPYHLLSSGEKCMFALAMMTEVARRADTELKLVLIDDMLDHLDDENIGAVLSRMAIIDDVQYIFAGVKAFPDTVDSSNVTVIHVEKD